jgi:hypothetical protein
MKSVAGVAGSCPLFDSSDMQRMSELQYDLSLRGLEDLAKCVVFDQQMPRVVRKPRGRGEVLCRVILPRSTVPRVHRDRNSSPYPRGRLHHHRMETWPECSRLPCTLASKLMAAVLCYQEGVLLCRRRIVKPVMAAVFVYMWSVNDDAPGFYFCAVVQPCCGNPRM